MKRERLHSYYSLLTLTALLLANLMLPKALTAQTHPASADLSFTILQLNDIYEIAPLRGSDEGGLARVATIRKQLLQENPNTITVLAGGFVSPSLTGPLSYRHPLTPHTQKIARKQIIELLN